MRRKGENDMRKTGIALAALVLCLFWAATVLAASVTATGQGATEREALHAAMREAIEQKIGVLVDSQTYVENYRVIHDRIYTHSEGYIAGYDILKSEYKNGYYEITLRADVREDLLNTDLMSNLQKKGFLKNGALCIVETRNNEELNLPENFQLTDERIYGMAKIRFYTFLI